MEGRGRDPLISSKRYLFIHVCRVRNCPGRPDSLISVEADLGSHTSDKTRPLKKSSSKEDEWDDVIALPISDDHPLRYSNPGGSLEIRLLNDGGDTVGSVVFDSLTIDPIIDTTKSPAPQWHKLWKQGKLTTIELLLSTWFSTNHHEAFRKSNLWHSAPVVYIQPNLWYLRISFHLLGDQQDATRIQPATHLTLSLPPSPLCTLNLLRALSLGYILLPAAEPLQTPLHISIFLADALLFEKRVPMSDVHRRISGRMAENKMCVVLTGVAGLRLGLTLEGGYHFFDEQARNSSDFRPTAPNLQPPSVAHLDLCFKEADFLAVEAGQPAVSSPYCVAKYGGKWARTSYQSGPRPLWDDEFSWSVYDPCTVITIGVFDRGGSGKERRLGKLRVRLSTMRSGHNYDQSFALWVLGTHTGMVNTGFVRLCMRLTPVSWFSLLTKYWLPLWPKLHYEDPLNPSYVENARADAMVVIAEYMERAEPPLPKEVVTFLLQGEPRMWVGRKTRSLQRRLVEALLPLKASVLWLSRLRKWNNVFYITSVVIVSLFFFYFPDAIPYVIVMAVLILAGWNYCFMRPVKLPGINPCLSLGRPSCCHGCNHAYMKEMKEATIEDEVDPFRWVPERVKVEDGRVEISTRFIFGEARAHLFCLQEVLEWLVKMVEKAKSLVSWRDQRATAIFMAYILAKVGMQYCFSIPLWGVLWIHVIMFLGPLLSGHVTPSIFVNFFKRLPTRCDTIL